MRVICLLLVSCGRSVEAPPPGPEPVPVPIATSARPSPSEPDPIAWEARYAATQVLVAHAGAVGAPMTATRSEEEARTRAEEIRAEAVAGTPLEELARTMSDGPSAPRGGRLGVSAVDVLVLEIYYRYCRLGVFTF